MNPDSHLLLRHRRRQRRRHSVRPLRLAGGGLLLLFWCVLFLCVRWHFEPHARWCIHTYVYTHSLSLVHHTDLLLLLLLLLLAEEERGGGEEAQGHLQRPAVHLFLCCRRGVVLSRERPWWCWSGGMTC